MFCLEQSIVATSHFGQVAAPVKCRRWTCPNCVEWRSRCLRARGIEGKPNRFITLTCRRGQYASPLDAAQAMVKAWRTIVLRWRRLKPYHKCEYLCVFEPHKSGWPHMHILWRGHWIDQKWLSEQGAQLLNSPVQHIFKITNAKSAVAYVTKYFSKAPTKFGTLKRYWTSKGWPKITVIDAGKAFHKGFPVEMVNTRIAQVVSEWIRYGKSVWYQKPDVAGWGALWEPKRPERENPRAYWRFRSGIPHLKTQEGWLH